MRFLKIVPVWLRSIPGFLFEEGFYAEHFAYGHLNKSVALFENI
jgi:hypothetical protein